MKPQKIIIKIESRAFGPHYQEELFKLFGSDNVLYPVKLDNYGTYEVTWINPSRKIPDKIFNHTPDWVFYAYIVQEERPLKRLALGGLFLLSLNLLVQLIVYLMILFQFFLILRILK